jgi:hypothetical protein
MQEWILFRIFKCFLEEELKSHAYRFVLFLNLLSWNIGTSDGGALSFNSCWIKWFSYTHRRVNG